VEHQKVGKQGRDMTTQNSNRLQGSSSIIHVMKRYVGRFVYLTVLCGHIPTLFPYFVAFRYPYILLHFLMFFLVLLMSLLLAQDMCYKIGIIINGSFLLVYYYT